SLPKNNFAGVIKHFRADRQLFGRRLSRRFQLLGFLRALRLSLEEDRNAHDGSTFPIDLQEHRCPISVDNFEAVADCRRETIKPIGGSVTTPPAVGGRCIIWRAPHKALLLGKALDWHPSGLIADTLSTFLNCLEALFQVARHRTDIG